MARAGSPRSSARSPSTSSASSPAASRIGACARRSSAARSPTRALVSARAMAPPWMRWDSWARQGGGSQAASCSILRCAGSRSAGHSLVRGQVSTKIASACSWPSTNRSTARAWAPASRASAASRSSPSTRPLGSVIGVESGAARGDGGSSAQACPPGPPKLVSRASSPTERPRLRSARGGTRGAIPEGYQGLGRPRAAQSTTARAARRSCSRLSRSSWGRTRAERSIWG